MTAFAPLMPPNSLARVGFLAIWIHLTSGMGCSKVYDSGSHDPGITQEFSSPVEAAEYFYAKDGAPAFPGIFRSAQPTNFELIVNTYPAECIQHYGGIASDASSPSKERIKAVAILSLVREESQLQRVYEILKTCCEDRDDNVAGFAVHCLALLPCRGVSKVVTAHLLRLWREVGHRIIILASAIEGGDPDLERFLDQQLGPAAALPARPEYAVEESEAISIQAEVQRAGFADSGFLLFCYQLKCSLQTIASSDAKDRIQGLIDGYPPYKAFFESHSYPLWRFIREIQICAVRSRNRELMEPLLAFKNRAMKEYSQWYARKGMPFALKSVLTEAKDSPAIYSSHLRQLLVSLRLLGFPLSAEEEQVLTEMGIIDEARLLLRSRGIFIKQDK